MTFLALLLIAHFIGDFILQPDAWVNSKFKKGLHSSGFWKHIAVHAFLLLLIYFIYPKYAWELAIVAVGHLIIDASKIMFMRLGHSHTKNIAAFLIDQILHISLIIVVCAYSSLDIQWDNLIQPHFLWILLGYLILTFPAAAVMRVLLSPYGEDITTITVSEGKNWLKLFIQTDEETTKVKSLKNGGKFIGIAERLLIFTFILIGQWAAVGFLITAKSVFRFGDLNQGKNRQFTEYVLIGTLLSFGLAIAVALIIQFIITHTN